MEKFAQVVHSMQALLEEEMDLVQGQVVKITEIIDKDWYRGESDGKTGTFPASFVRIIDSFPGDAPPDSADISSYLKKSQRYAYFVYYIHTGNMRQLVVDRRICCCSQFMIFLLELLGQAIGCLAGPSSSNRKIMN